MRDSVADGDIAPLDSFSAERGRRLFRAIFSGLLIRPLALIIPFISVPLFLKYLGNERYGLYEVVIGASAWLSLSNAGLTTGLVNRLTECEVSGDRQLARRYVSSLWFAMVALCLLFTLIATMVIPLVSWADVFKVQGRAGRSEIALVLWTTALITFIQSILGVPAAAYTAAQQIEKYNYWDGACKLSILLACFVVVHTPLGLLGVALATLGAPCAVRILNMLYLFTFERPWLRPRLTSFDITLVRSAMLDGILIFLLQVASLAIISADKLIIGFVLGSSEVVGFALLSRRSWRL